MPVHGAPRGVGAVAAAAAVLVSLQVALSIAAATDLDPSVASAPRASARFTYSLQLTKAAVPALSINNPPGQGHSPCNFTFNPAWIEPSAGTGGKSALLVRAAECPASFGGTGDHIMLADCDASGTCEDLKPITLPFEPEAQDPRVLYDESTGIYYLWYYASGSGLSTVYLRSSKTPLDPTSWTRIGPAQPWHRNGCAFPRMANGSHLIVFGEAPPLPALGIARSDDGFKTYTTLNATWLKATGSGDAREPEIVVEASTPVVALSTGDFLHLYSAGTPGWVPNGNYTAGWVVMARDDPTVIEQRSTQHVLVASKDYEGVPPLHGFPVNRYRTTFVTSIVPVQPGSQDWARGVASSANKSAVSDVFRLWWGAADANVATGLLTVTASPAA